MYTIDASVWVNSFDEREPGYGFSRRLLELVSAQAVPVYVPRLLLAEVAGAISRTRNEPTRAREFASALSRLPNVVFVELDNDLATRATSLAAQHRLRGADAVYGAVAQTTASTLISLDAEHLTRLVDVVPVQTPADALPRLLQASKS